MIPAWLHLLAQFDYSGLSSLRAGRHSRGVAQGPAAFLRLCEYIFPLCPKLVFGLKPCLGDGRYSTEIPSGVPSVDGPPIICSGAVPAHVHFRRAAGILGNDFGCCGGLTSPALPIGAVARNLRRGVRVAVLRLVDQCTAGVEFSGCGDLAVAE
jgi:hypothetical protein